MDSSKLIKLIRKVVKEEIRRAVKPIVNEVLAEHFIKVLGESKTSPKISDTFVVADSPPEQQKIAKRQAYERQMLQEKINKIAGGDPMSEMIFGDIDGQDRSAFHMPESPVGSFVDSDDDGVDLSRFGL